MRLRAAWIEQWTRAQGLRRRILGGRLLGSKADLTTRRIRPLYGRWNGRFARVLRGGLHQIQQTGIHENFNLRSLRAEARRACSFVFGGGRRSLRRRGRVGRRAPVARRIALPRLAVGVFRARDLARVLWRSSQSKGERQFFPNPQHPRSSARAQENVRPNPKRNGSVGPRSAFLSIEWSRWPKPAW